MGGCLSQSPQVLTILQANPSPFFRQCGMLKRKPVFPHVIEINHQAGQRLGCNVYLVYDASEWILIDVGFQDTADEILEVIRQLDFPLASCKTIIATHADVDHIQGLAKFKQALKTTVSGHRLAADALAKGDLIKTFAEIEAQNIHLEMPPVQVRAADRRGRHDRDWRSEARSLAHARATPTASFRFAWASYCSAATTSIATAAWAPSTPITAATFPSFIRSR